MPTNNYIYSTTVPSDQTGIYIPAIQRNTQAQSGAAEQTAKKRGDKKTSQTFKKAKKQIKKSSNKTPKQVEEANAKKQHDQFNTNVNGVTVNPFDIVQKQFSPSNYITEITKEQFKNQIPTSEQLKDFFGVYNTKNDPNSPWYKKAGENAIEGLSTLGKMAKTPFETFMLATSLYNPAAVAKGIGAFTAANNSIRLLGSDRSITDIAADNLPISRSDAEMAGMMLAGLRKPVQQGYINYIEPKIAPARAISRAINNTEPMQVFPKTFQPPFIRYQRGTLDDVENNIRIQDMFEPTKAAWRNPSIIGSGHNIPGRPPHGLSRRIRIFDASDPNAVYPQEYLTPTGRMSYGEGNAVELTKQHRNRFTDVSSKVPEDNPEVQELLGAYASMETDPNLYPSLRNLVLSTTTPTPRNIDLLESMARNLELYPNGTREGFLPWNPNIKPEVPIYGTRPLESRPIQQQPRLLTEQEMADEAFMHNMETLPEPPSEVDIPSEVLNEQLPNILSHPDIQGRYRRGSVLSNSMAQNLLDKGYSWPDILSNFRVQYPVNGTQGVRPSYQDIRETALKGLAHQRNRIQWGETTEPARVFWDDWEGTLNIPNQDFRHSTYTHSGMSNIFLGFNSDHTEPRKVIDYIQYVTDPQTRQTEHLAQNNRGIDVANIGEIISDPSQSYSIGSIIPALQHFVRGFNQRKILYPKLSVDSRGRLNTLGNVGMFDHQTFKRQYPETFNKIKSGNTADFKYRLGSKQGEEAFEPVEIYDNNDNLVGVIRSRSNQQQADRVNNVIRRLTESMRETYEDPNGAYQHPLNPYHNIPFENFQNNFLITPGNNPGQFYGPVLGGSQIMKKGGKLIKRIK